MQIVFLTAGKRMANNKILEVTAEQVKKEIVFSVDEANARDYIKAKKAVEVKEEEVKEPETNIDKMTVAELDNFAAGLEPIIDISEAKNKAEKLLIIKSEIEIRKAELEATKTDD